MKKTYSKPEIIFDDFSLSTAITGNCEVKLWTPNNESCGYKPEGYDAFIFVQDIDGCEEKFPDGGFWGDTMCYHVPSESRNLFNS